jgi:hypothetical protein
MEISQVDGSLAATLGGDGAGRGGGAMTSQVRFVISPRGAWEHA